MAVQAGTFVSDATLVGLVKELRRALHDHDDHAPVIRTVHRVGYAFCPVVHAGGAAVHALVWHWLVFRGRRIVLRRGENSIGRDPGSDVWLDVAGVSRRHARIIVGDYDASLEDLESKNGTTLGEVRVRQTVALEDGASITFGPVVRVYRETYNSRRDELRHPRLEQLRAYEPASLQNSDGDIAMPEIDSFFQTAKQVTTFEEEVREVVEAALAHQASLRPGSPGQSFPFCMVLNFSGAIPFPPFIINREHKATISQRPLPSTRLETKPSSPRRSRQSLPKRLVRAVQDGSCL